MTATFPSRIRLSDARETCTLKGRCKIGWIGRAELGCVGRGEHEAGQAHPAERTFLVFSCSNLDPAALAIDAIDAVLRQRCHTDRLLRIRFVEQGPRSARHSPIPVPWRVLRVAKSHGSSRSPCACWPLGARSSTNLAGDWMVRPKGIEPLASCSKCSGGKRSPR
jgi:hypothetical protein